MTEVRKNVHWESLLINYYRRTPRNFKYIDSITNDVKFLKNVGNVFEVQIYSVGFEFTIPIWPILTSCHEVLHQSANIVVFSLFQNCLLYVSHRATLKIPSSLPQILSGEQSVHKILLFFSPNSLFL